MQTNKKTASAGYLTIILIAIILLLFAWAPWMDEKQIHGKVLAEKGKIDHTIDENGSVVCDYYVNWFPFGRIVSSCEGGYFVSFWGQIF